MAECFLAASSSLGVAQLCDARTGAVVRTLKDCHAARAGLIATSHFALAAESTRSYLHMWVWSRDQPQYRCQAPERVHCVVCSEDAAYCVGGAASGRVYLWSVPTGRLLYAWDAHFRACSAVEFAADGGFVVSAGEDAVVHAWNMAALLHAAATAAAAPRAYRTWTEHTLPVCALCTSPCGQHGLIGSASLDHTVKLWRLAEGVVGSVHSWPLDAPLSAIAAHPAHVALYAGTADGHVHALHLQARAGAVTASVAVLAAAAAAAAAGGTAASELAPRPPYPQLTHSELCGADPTASSAAATCHAGAVVSICAGADGTRLFTAGAEGGVWAWDTRSLLVVSRFLPGAFATRRAHPHLAISSRRVHVAVRRSQA